MKKRFITTAAMAAITATMLLNGCGSSQTASTSAPQTETQAPSTEAKPDETEETTAAPETGGPIDLCAPTRSPHEWFRKHTRRHSAKSR